MAPLSEHFQRILVPVDFLPASDEAVERGTAVEIQGHDLEFAPASLQSVRLAAALARSTNGQIIMVHATPPLQASTIYTGPIAVSAQVIRDIHTQASKSSTEVMELLRARYCDGIEVEIVARPGTPLLVVLEEATRTQADLIVMAASGRSRVARFFVGSTADRVVRQAGCPVLVVPAHHAPRT